MESNVFISIICPVYNEERFIKLFLDSIVAQDYDKNNLEIFIIDGMSKDRTRTIVELYAENEPTINLLNNLNGTVSPALNIGVARSRGKYIIRLDAHAIYPSNYFSTLIAYAEKLGADNIGGVVRTLPVNKSSKASAIANALSHPFGMGNSYFRVGTSNIRKVDTVPFGCFRSEIFKKIGLFDVELIRNQDDEFNARILKHGGVIYIIPDLIIDYYARDTIYKIFKMFYQYGLFKPLVNKKLGSPATIRQFFPVFFVSAIIVGSLLSWFSDRIFLIYILIIFLYFVLGFIFSLNESLKKKDLKILFLLQFTFFVVHSSYGLGYLEGLYKIFSGSEFKVNTNR